MKMAITGKGGVGKTTTCALLAKAFVNSKHQVLIIDADSNPTLGSCLGFPDCDQIPPINEMADLIEERTGAKPGVPGGFFKLNPRVNDIPEKYSMEREGVRLLRMGSIKAGGAGCYCAENVLLKNLVSYILLDDQDVLIMDMEAGVEHLTRGTAQGVDWLLIVVEPSRQSIDTAKRISTLAKDIGIKHIGVVGNKCRNNAEIDFIEGAVIPIPLLGIIPYSDSLRLAELEGCPPDPNLPAVSESIQKIISRLSNDQEAGQDPSHDRGKAATQ